MLINDTYFKIILHGVWWTNDHVVAHFVANTRKLISYMTQIKTHIGITNNKIRTTVISVGIMYNILYVYISMNYPIYCSLAISHRYVNGGENLYVHKCSTFIYIQIHQEHSVPELSKLWLMIYLIATLCHPSLYSVTFCQGTESINLILTWQNYLLSFAALCAD